MTDESERLLGGWLKQRREELEISVEQAEQETRIRSRYLTALESEDIDSLPDPVVSRGFLRNYATYLGLDPKEALDRFSGFLAPPVQDSMPSEEPSPFDTPFRPVALHKMPSLSRRSRTLGLFALAIIVLAAVSLAVWLGYPRLVALMTRTADTPAPTLVATFTPKATEASTATTHTPAPAVTETSEPTPFDAPATPILTITLMPTFTPSPSPSPSAPVYTGIFLELVFTDTSWVQVSTDGVRQFQGELEVDTYRSWYGDNRVELRIGNAGAVLVTVNGELLGTLGPSGDVVERIFEKVDDGVMQATATPEIEGTAGVEQTPVPTNEPTIALPSPTISPINTITPTISPTNTITPTTPVTPTASP